MGREFTACRVSGDGNAIFPNKIIIDSLRKELIFRKPRLIGYKESRVRFDAIGSVSIRKGILFSDICIETNGGMEIIARGFTPSDARTIARLVNQNLNGQRFSDPFDQDMWD